MLPKFMLKLLKKHETVIFRILITFIILMIPLYPKFPILDVPGTHVFIRLEDFILLITSIFIILTSWKKIVSFLKTSVGKAIFLFLGVGILSVFSGIFITKTVSPQLGILHWGRRLEYFIPLFLWLCAPKKKQKEFVLYTVKLILIVVFGVFIYGVGQKYFSWPVIITQNQEYSKGVALKYVHGGHMISTYAGHYDLATSMVLFLPIIWSFYVFSKDKRDKLLLFLAAVSGLWLLSNSLSRISVFSYLVSIFITLILLRKKRFIPFILAVSILIFGFSSSLLDRYIRVFQVFEEKVGTTLVGDVLADDGAGLPQRLDIEKTPTPTPVPVFEDRSASIRINVEWPRAVRSLEKNPLLGTGYSSITLATDNDFLRLLGEAGILGFLAFILIFLELLTSFSKRNGFSQARNEAHVFTIAFLGSTIGVFGNALFIDVFEASKFATVYWLLVGLFLYAVKGALEK